MKNIPYVSTIDVVMGELAVDRQRPGACFSAA